MGRKARQFKRRTGPTFGFPKTPGVSSLLWKLGRRDNWICWICRRTIQYVDSPQGMYPTRDHLIPRSLGGPSALWNLRICHYQCNASRDHSVPPPAAELTKLITSSMYESLLTIFASAYGYSFSAHERGLELIKADEGESKASSVPLG